MGFNILQLLVIFVFLLGIAKHKSEGRLARFDDNYFVTFGNDHVSYENQGQIVDLEMDKVTGAGFSSKIGYGSGFFGMIIKLPAKRSPGVVTTFYLTDKQSGNHDEIDFEFLGTDGPPFLLQTNLFANDNGGREQRFRLWFDPSKSFHKYGVLWNDHQIVFFVDDVPIRVYRNLTNIGGRYPKNEMFVEGTIWNGESWASGGRKVDWSQAPFVAQYQRFDINGCKFGSGCNSQMYWWNNKYKYWQLSPDQKKALVDARKKYMYEDYCKGDTKGVYKECHVNN